MFPLCSKRPALGVFSFCWSGKMAAKTDRTVSDATDDEIDALVAEFGGDPREAIRALLHDLTELAIDSEAAVSRGYVRGRLLPFQLRQTVGGSHHE
jgi:ATP-dependent exoDNAse (exonuclease V) alpha subunit